jgi:serine protease Do
MALLQLDRATANDQDPMLANAVAKIAPALVRIDTIGGTERVAGLRLSQGPTTGVVIDEGWIISSSFNFVRQPSSILITFADGTRRSAERIATDHSRKLTLLRVDNPTQINPPELRPVADVQVGQWAIAAGRTFDAPLPNVSLGIISATKRIWGKALQTDAKVSPANYGGALIDLEGRLLGILVPLSPDNPADVAGVEWYDSGIGFAIPCDDIQRVLPRLKQGEDLRPGLAGFSIGGDDPLSQPPTLAAVRVNSPAAKAGLKADDRVVAIDGHPVHRHNQLREQLQPRYAGDQITITVARGDQQIDVQLELVDHIDPFVHPFAGLFPLPPQEGLPGIGIRGIIADSPAQQAGLTVEDRILAINGEEVTQAEQLRQRLCAAGVENTVKLNVQRDGQSREVSLQLIAMPGEVPGDALPRDLPDPASRPDRPAVGRVTLKIPEFTPEALALVPENYDPRLAHGLLIWLHEAGGYQPDKLAERWLPLAEQNHWIVVCPQALDPARWTPPEVGYIAKLVEDVRRQYNIDPARTALAGRDFGGAMAYAVAFLRPETARGIIAIDAISPGQPPDHDPVSPLSILGLVTPGLAQSPRATAVLEQLREMAYPVAEATREPGQDDLSDEELQHIVRWLDHLDRI